MVLGKPVDGDLRVMMRLQNMQCSSKVQPGCMVAWTATASAACDPQQLRSWAALSYTKKHFLLGQITAVLSM